MKIDEGTLYLDEPIQDEAIEEFIAILSQDDIERIELNTDSVDPASMQVLLCSSQKRFVDAKDEYFQKLFESVNDN